MNDLQYRELIVLGCTHYPLVKDYISENFNHNINILDMSECILIDGNNSYQKIDLYFSELNNNIIKNIIKANINSINLIENKKIVEKLFFCVI